VLIQSLVQLVDVVADGLQVVCPDMQQYGVNTQWVCLSKY
jgi:hypothetical protein